MQARRVEQATRENERQSERGVGVGGRGERERGNGGAVSETTPSRNLDEETFECTPEGGEAIMR